MKKENTFQGILLEKTSNEKIHKISITKLRDMQQRI